MKTVTSLLLFASLTGVSFRLIAGDGSVYSSYGIGDILTYGGNRSSSMGGTGIASLNGGYINLLNPAGLGQLTRTQYSGDFQYKAMNSTTERDQAF